MYVFLAFPEHRSALSHRLRSTLPVVLLSVLYLQGSPQSAFNKWWTPQVLAELVLLRGRRVGSQDRFN